MVPTALGRRSAPWPAGHQGRSARPAQGPGKPQRRPGRPAGARWRRSVKRNGSVWPGLWALARPPRLACCWRRRSNRGSCRSGPRFRRLDPQRSSGRRPHPGVNPLTGQPSPGAERIAGPAGGRCLAAVDLRQAWSSARPSPDGRGACLCCRGAAELPLKWSCDRLAGGGTPDHPGRVHLRPTTVVRGPGPEDCNHDGQPEMPARP